jgi:hypothetical protein
VLSAKRDEPERIVLFRVLAASRAEIPRRYDPHDRGEDFLPWKAGESEVLRDRGAHFRQRFGERDHSPELRRFTPPDVRVVVSVLPASRGILSDRLEGGSRRPIDRDVRPSWRKAKGVNPAKVVAGDRGATGMLVPKSALLANSPNSGLLEFFDSGHRMG